MRRYALIVFCLALMAGFSWSQNKPTTPKTTTPPPKTERKNGDITGSVTSIESQRGEKDKGLLIVVKVSGDSQSLVLYAAPQNSSIYGAAGELKVGDKVKASWMSDTAIDTKKWITQIALTTPAPKPAATSTESPKGESKTGDLTGNVTGVEAQKGEQGLLLVVHVSGEGQSLILYAKPQDRSSYGMAGLLKVGEKVKAGWKSESATDKKWVTQFQIVPVPPKPPTTTPTTPSTTHKKIY